MDQPKAVYHPDKHSLPSFVLEQHQPDDVILTLGAGDITKVGHELARVIKKK